MTLHVRGVSLLRVATNVSALQGHHTGKVAVFGLGLGVSWNGGKRGWRKGRVGRVVGESCLTAELVGLRAGILAELASSHRVKAHGEVAAHSVLVSGTSVSAHALLTVDFSQGVGMVHRVVSKVTRVRVRVISASSTASAHVAVAVHVATKAHHTALMTVIVSTTARAVSSGVRVMMTTAHLLALQLGLDSLAVGSVSDHGENRSNALDELDKDQQMSASAHEGLTSIR